jgi:hypothetical protein
MVEEREIMVELLEIIVAEQFKMVMGRNHNFYL